jgi:hypothetical protein
MTDYAQSYIVRTRKTITRQAGDSGSIEVIVPETLSLSGWSVYFEVTDAKLVPIFTKDSEEDTIAIEDQTIYVLLSREDTSELEGVYNWEMEIYKGDDTITIGKGQYIIIKETARKTYT